VGAARGKDHAMMTRALTCWLLVLSLAIGSAGGAVARHAPQVAGFIALCTTTGETQMAVDANGNPVTPHHACPDCTLSALAPQTGTLPVWRALAATLEPALPSVPPRADARRHAHCPRGPPLLA
jgi:hypothetical protein